MDRRPTLIELTSKKWKALAVKGLALALGGYVLAFIAYDSALWLFLCGTVSMIGCGILIYANVMSWWHHG